MARRTEENVTDGFCRVKDGPYRLYSDTWCVWITKEVQSKTGTVYEKRVAGYSANLMQLAESFLDRKVHDSEAEGMKAILKEIAEARKEYLAIIKKYLNKAGAWKK